MIKSILAPATGNDTDAEVFTSALAVARPLGAHIDFLHVRLDAARFAATISPEVSSGRVVTDLIKKPNRASKEQKSRSKAFAGASPTSPIRALLRIYAFSQTELRKSGPCGAV
jgi:hypothetical protein